MGKHLKGNQSYSLPYTSIKDSIATRLLTVVFSIYFIVTLSVTLTHMAAEYYDTKQTIIQDIQTFFLTFEPGLAQFIWNVDTVGLKAATNGMLQIPLIVGLQIEDDLGEILSSSGTLLNKEGKIVNYDSDGEIMLVPPKHLYNNLFELSYPIFRRVEGKEPIEIGKARIYSSTGIVFEKVRYGFAFIIVNSIIKTMALWLIFLWVGRKLLTRPLYLLTRATEELNLDNLEHYKPIDVETKGRNELKILEEAFNLTVSKLKASKRELEEAKQRVVLLLSTTQEMAFAGSVQFTVIERALTAMVEVLPCLSSTVCTMYYPEQGGGKSGYAWFRMPVMSGVDGHSSLQMNVQLTQHDFTLKDPWELHQQEPSEELATRGNCLYIPCWSEKRLLCLLVIENIDSSRLNKEEYDFVNVLTHSLSLSLRNIEYHTVIADNVRMESELQTAAAVQQALFPKTLPQGDNLEWATYFESASETGGDWFGFMTQFRNQLFVMIGDVTGHGTPAALVTATACSACKVMEEIFYLDYTIRHKIPSPADCLYYLNTAVYEVGHPNYLMTFFVGQIDLETGKMVFSNAAHNFPLLLRKDGKLKHLLNANTRLGYREVWEFSESSVQLEEGDTLLFYTDGLIENTNSAGEEWGEKRLKRVLKNSNDLSATEVMERIKEKAKEFYQSQPYEDDVTLLSCRVTKPFPKRNN